MNYLTLVFGFNVFENLLQTFRVFVLYCVKFFVSFTLIEI